jgi:pilus assembly protein CpaC
MTTRSHCRIAGLPGALLTAALCLASVGALAQAPPPGASAARVPPSTIIQDIGSASERLDLYVNSSKLIRLHKPIPKAMVQNPEIAELHARGDNLLQVVGKKAGFTIVTLWDTDNRMYGIDVLVISDGRELDTILKRQFPKASLTVMPMRQKVVIEGSVDDPTHVNQIVDIAKDFYPDVINRITVGGVQQVLLHVKVMEVSRTKLRRFGIDWARISPDRVAVQSVSGLLAASGVTSTLGTSGAETFKVGLLGSSSEFFGVIEALRQNNLAKVLAEPVLVTVSGRPAFFNSGGEFPILVPGSLGTVSIEYKKFGTQVDFVPVVLSNGHIRLEVRPRISEIDPTRSVTLGSFTVPGLRTREVDTGVEMQAGETLAIAGLVQTRVESETKGLPWLMDIPYVGAGFRRVANEENEIELLVMVTPELVHAMQPHEVPQCGPGTFTTSPGDCELMWKAYLEVPKCCGPGCGPECQGGGPGALMGPGEWEMIPGPGTAPGTAPPQPPKPPAAARPMGGPGVRPVHQGVDAPRSPVDPSRSPASPAPQARVPRRPAPDSRTYPSNPSVPTPAGPQTPGSEAPGFYGATGYDVRN